MKYSLIASLTLFIALCFFSSAKAAEAPALCPTVAAIKQAGLSAVLKEESYKLYAVYQVNKYNTPEMWGFLMGVPFEQATSKGDAMNKARMALPTLTGDPIPTPVDDSHKQWYCLYDDDYHYVAIAATPVIAAPMVHTLISHAHPASR